MKEWISDRLVEIIIVIAIIFVVIGCIGGMITSHIENTKLWNNGYCDCGGKWEYVETTQTVRGSEGSIYTSKGYIYKCNRYGKMHEFDEVR